MTRTRGNGGASRSIQLGAAPAEHKLPRVSGSHAVYPGNNRPRGPPRGDSPALLTGQNLAVLAAAVVLAAVGAGRAYGPLALPSSAALSVPPCWLHARLAPWTRQLPAVQGGLRRVCTALATAHEKVRYSGPLSCWRRDVEGFPLKRGALSPPAPRDSSLTRGWCCTCLASACPRSTRNMRLSCRRGGSRRGPRS